MASHCLQVGLAQTAYANGASTQYLREQLPACQLAFARTGVKYLHAEAEHFDIGIYYEANGHGTVLFREQLQKALALVGPSFGLACGSLQVGA